MGLAGDIALIVLAAFAGGVVARRLGVPLILGYMLAGVLVGPHTAGPTVAEREQIELLADIGVALLLFALGLDFPLHKLAPVRRVALLGTTLQIALTGALGYGAGRLLGWDWREAAWLGALVSLSSTMVVLKTLTDLGLRDALAGRVMVGVLLVQDLAVVPLMILMPALEDVDGKVSALGVAALRAGLFVGGMVLFGTRVFPWLMRRIAGWNSRELFLLSVVALGLGVGYATYLFGLPFAFGAFVAGVLLSGSDYSYQALHDVTPLRDVFAMLFFVSVGMLLDPAVLARNAATVAFLVGLLLVGKGLILGGVTRAFGYRNAVPLAVGLGLFQVGEFSFVLARVGTASGALSPEAYATVLATAVSTMALTPVAMRLTPALYARWRARFPAPQAEPRGVPAGLRDHVVILGYGRLGRFVAQVLRRLGHPFAVVDLDPARVAEAQAAGIPVIYGDAAAEPVLEAAGVGAARLVLLALPDPVTVRLAVERTRRLNPGVHIVARAAGVEQIEELGRLGVYEAVQPELEAGLELAHQALAHLGVGAEEILRFTEAVRRELYAPLTVGAADDRLLAQLRRRARLIEVEWIPIPEGSPLAGRSIGECRVRQRTGASVVAVLRADSVLANPGPRLVLRPGDTVGVIGTADQRAAFRQLALDDTSGEREAPGS